MRLNQSGNQLFFIYQAGTDPRKENKKPKSGNKNKGIRHRIPSNIFSAWVQPH